MISKVLLYHDIVENEARLSETGFRGNAADSYKLDRVNFSQHLQAVYSWSKNDSLAKSHVGGWYEMSGSHDEQVLFTFDDAGSCGLQIADLLEAYSWRGIFFAPTDFIDTPGFMTSSDLRELAKRGHCVGSHSASHPLRMADLDWEHLLREWETSLKKLSDILGYSVDIASVPGGLYSAEVRRSAEVSGVRILFNSAPTVHPVLHGQLTVVGRLSLKRACSAAKALAFARGDKATLLRENLTWSSKNLIKRLVGPGAIGLRDRLFTTR